MASMPVRKVRVAHCRAPPGAKYSCLARNDTRRGVTSGIRKLSRKDRWLAARITGPVRGTLPAPVTSGRKASPAIGRNTARSVVASTSTPQVGVDGGLDERLRRVEPGRHLHAAPLPELRDAVHGGPEGTCPGGGLREVGPFQQLHQYAEQRLALLPQPDVVTPQQIVPEHEREHPRLITCKRHIPPSQ